MSSMGTIWAEMGLRLDKLDAGVRLAQAKVQTAAELVGSRTSRMSNVFQRVGDGVSNLVSRVVTLKNVLVAAAGAGVVGLGLRFDATLEQANIQFQVLTGSADEARRVVEYLYRYAAKTPFEFQGVLKAASVVRGAKLDMQQWIPTIGDMAAAGQAAGLTMDEVAMAIARVRSGNVGEFFERVGAYLGMTRQDLAQYGIQWQATGELADRSAAGIEKVLAAIQQEATKRFKGMSDAQSQTFSGLFSTLKDNATMLLGTVVEPLFERIKQAFPGINDAVAKVAGAFKDAGLRGAISNLFPPDVAVPLIKGLDTVEQAVSRLVEYLRSAFEAMWPAVEQAGTKVWHLMAALWPILKDVGGLLAAAFVNAVPPILAVVGHVSDFVAWLLKAQPLVYAIGGALAGWAVYQGILQGVAAATKLWTTAQWLLNAAMTANPVGLVIVGIGALAGLLYGLYKAWTSNWGGIRDKTAAAFASLKSAFNSFIGFIKQWWPLVLAPLTGGLSLVGLLFTNKGRELLHSAIEWGSNIVKGLWNGLVSLTSWLIDKVSAWISDVIPGPIKKVLGIASPSKVMDEYGQNVGEGLAQGMEKQAPTVAATAQSLADAISERVQTATERIGLALDVLQAKWELQQKQMGDTAAQAEALAAKQAFLQQQLALVKDKVSVLTDAYNQMREAKGAATEETQKLYLELLKEQAAQIDLQRSIEETTKAMQHQLQIKDGMAYVDQGGYSIGVPVGPARSWDEGRNSAEVIAIAQRQGVDLGTAASMYDANQDAVAQGKIPQYGRGGYVRRPTLALIGERGPEVVAPPAPLASTIGDAVYRAVRDALHVLRPDVPETGSQPVILSLDPLGLKRLGQALIPAMQAERIRRGEA